MKRSLIETVVKRKLVQTGVAAVLMITLFFFPGQLFSQTDSTRTDSTQKEGAAITEEESSLISPSIEFVSVQKSDNTIDLKAALKAKVKGTVIKLPLLKVTFVQVTEAGDNVLGFVITDRSGKAVFNTKADSLKTDLEGKLHFKVLFAGNKAMEPAEEEVTVKRARLEIVPVKADSLLTVQVKLVDIGAGTVKPVPGTVLGIYVKRLFYPLKVGEGTTDENGVASVEIPNNLPGDTIGNITLLAKLEEHELYGNLEAGVTQKWGIAVSDKLIEQPRALWSEHPPIWMIVTFIVLMTIVWGHYFVIIYELIRLRKEEPGSPIKKTIFSKSTFK
jgi:hypothetical protein